MRRILSSGFETVLTVAVAPLAFALVIYDSVADRIADMRRRRAWRKGPEVRK